MAGTISYRTELDTGNSFGAATKTWTAADIGTASADRIVIVGILAKINAAGTLTVSTVTINGVSATSCCTQSTLVNEGNAAFFAAIVPTDATGDIVVTWSANVFNGAIGVWATTGISSVTANSSAGQTNTTALTYSATIPAGAVGIGIGQSDNAAPISTASNLTENFDTGVGGSRAKAGASDAFATGQTTTIGQTFASNSANVGLEAVWAPVIASDGIPWMVGWAPPGFQRKTPVFEQQASFVALTPSTLPAPISGAAFARGWEPPHFPRAVPPGFQQTSLQTLTTAPVGIPYIYPWVPPHFPRRVKRELMQTSPAYGTTFGAPVGVSGIAWYKAFDQPAQRKVNVKQQQSEMSLLVSLSAGISGMAWYYAWDQPKQRRTDPTKQQYSMWDPKFMWQGMMRVTIMGGGR